MMVNFFLRMFLGHLIGDFILQPLWLAIAKRQGWPGLILHVSVVTLATGAMLYDSPHWLKGTVALFVLHMFIDPFRTFVFTDNSKGKGFVLFILDQIAHFISIILISWWVTGEGISSLAAIFRQALSQENAILFVLSLVVIAGWVAPILEIELLVAFQSFKQKPGDNKFIAPIHLSDRLMGGLERLVGLALAAVSLGLLLPLAYLPRLLWLGKTEKSAGYLSLGTKTGTSLITGVLLALLLLSVNLSGVVF